MLIFLIYRYVTNYKGGMIVMLKKILSTIGIGGARVDTKLDTSHFRQGSVVTGEIVVVGGSVEQSINDIYLAVRTKYKTETNDHTHWVNTTIEKDRVVEQFVIQPEETKVIPFSFVLPKQTPITIGYNSKVWIETELDIKNAVDHKDIDYITVDPCQEIEEVFKTVESLGFSLREAEVKHNRKVLKYHKAPFVQEFEFVPVSGSFRGVLDEIELEFHTQSENEIVVLMQIDKISRGLSGMFQEALDLDEKYVRFVINSDKIELISDTVRNIIFNNY